MLSVQCKQTDENIQTADQKNIDDNFVNEVQTALIETFGKDSESMIKKGVRQAASLWRTSDGTPDEFKTFCSENYFADAVEKETVFKKVSENFESLWSHQNKVLLDLNENMYLNNGSYHKIDAMFAAYSPGSHFNDDFYSNKIAFVIALNFPSYSLDEKNELGKNWTNLEWAYARMGDVFTAHVPAELSQKIGQAGTDADICVLYYKNDGLL